MGLEFKPMTETESAALREALRRNAEQGTPVRMDPLTTGWMPGQDEISYDEVISAIKSVPCHYAEEYVLARSGLNPLMFSGHLLAENNGKRQGGTDRNRWHEIAIYMAESGQYVVQICYRTQWQGEIDHEQAVVCLDHVEAVKALTTYDPCAQVVGFPAGAGYADKQARLHNNIRHRYESQVSAVLDAPEFAEVVK